MTDKTLDPRIAALWLVHGRACADLLRAHGRDGHAEHYEKAMAAVMDILAAELGRKRLAAAIDWVSDELWADRGSSARHAISLKH